MDSHQQICNANVCPYSADSHLLLVERCLRAPCMSPRSCRLPVIIILWGDFETSTLHSPDYSNNIVFLRSQILSSPLPSKRAVYTAFTIAVVYHWNKGSWSNFQHQTCRQHPACDGLFRSVRTGECGSGSLPFGCWAQLQFHYFPPESAWIWAPSGGNLNQCLWVFSIALHPLPAGFQIELRFQTFRKASIFVLKMALGGDREEYIYFQRKTPRIDLFWDDIYRQFQVKTTSSHTVRASKSRLKTWTSMSLQGWSTSEFCSLRNLHIPGRKEGNFSSGNGLITGEFKRMLIMSYSLAWFLPALLHPEHGGAVDPWHYFYFSGSSGIIALHRYTDCYYVCKEVTGDGENHIVQGFITHGCFDQGIWALPLHHWDLPWPFFRFDFFPSWIPAGGFIRHTAWLRATHPRHLRICSFIVSF